jgi:hypothetical protein
MYNYELSLVDSSRKLVDIMVAEIGNNQEKFDEMVMLALSDVYPVSMRAARIMTVSTFKHKHLLKPHLEAIIKMLPGAKVDGLKRSVLKILAEIPFELDEESIGLLTDTTFNYLVDPKEAIAVRAFSIGILLNISRRYPEIKPELKAILESILPGSSVGLKSKCRKTLRLIK